MIPAEIRQEVERLRGQVAQREREREEHRAELAAALAAPPALFSENDVSEARQSVTADDYRIARLEERIAALSALLPSAEAMSVAEGEARILLDALEAIGQQFEEGRSRFLAAIEVAEPLALSLSSTLREATATRNRLLDVVKQFGLDVPAPREAGLSDADSKAAQLLCLLLADVAACGEPSDIVMRDLAAARQRRSATNTAG